ncbi:MULTISPECIES: LuxR C-terminal-related transcriptional regulator [Pseudomonas]|uniref:LuxR C-terminal-related transcriptional regulator n=1 Tax=Pseudomonas TaxID=286 RepID=UPI001BE7AC69|nr:MULTISPECIES: LuxR C-terminal-related transcriptional regulator [Pseudomonas]MBT2341263.1 helix-turn-helix transcriptional regulator [Pseudomonas fluorescens]MCD4531871.1 LuxR C-terminal-related transcriptional regulator [Pseudomonas sp. C3-2018]
MTAMTPCPDRPGLLPRLSSTHVPRRSLSEPLLTSEARVKLLCAPAGSGKSALFAECFLQAPAECRLHWLPLGGAALSPAQMCERLAQTLGLPVMDEAGLLAHVARLHTPTWLFLDDYCRVPNPELDLLLDRLLNASSPALHLWLNGRRRPHCNWPRLLLDDELHEFDAQALFFTQGDVQQLLHHLPEPQAARTAREVIQRSGGWCAGVRISLLERCEWARSHATPGRAGTLLDYLDYELFSTLTPELAQAWRVLAHLPRFNARLCEHLFGDTVGAECLPLLRDLGCFIEPWEQTSDWLQIFPALARLVQDVPWPQGRSWHRRACQWFAAEQDWQMAFEQAMLAGEFEAAVSFLQHLSFEHVLQRRNVVLLLSLHDQQGEALSLGTPQSVGLVTAALLFAGRFDQASVCIEQLTRFAPQPRACQQRQLVARWQVLRGWLLHLDGEGDPAREHFLQAQIHLEPDAWASRLLCQSGLTQQALLKGELASAQWINRQALCLARAQGSLVFEGLLELDHAQVLEQRGAPHRADELLSDVQALLERPGQDFSPLLGRIALRRGRLALRMGFEERAAEQFQTGLETGLHSQDKQVLYGFLGKASLAANQGDYGEAFMQLRDAERIMQQRHIPDTVYRGVLLQTSCQFWLQQGRAELAHEALSRVLRHFRGAQAKHAPPATLELIPRLEYLLLLTEVHLHRAQDPLARLETMIAQARQAEMHSLETELHLALAEVAWLSADRSRARTLVQDGLQRVACWRAQQALCELRLRQPELLRWAQSVDQVESPAAMEDALLSHRELEVLELIAQGHSNQQIAERLFISLHTVKTHSRRIHSKLGVQRRTQAVAKAKVLGVMG